MNAKIASMLLLAISSFCMLPACTAGVDETPELEGSDEVVAGDEDAARGSLIRMTSNHRNADIEPCPERVTAARNANTQCPGNHCPAEFPPGNYRGGAIVAPVTNPTQAFNLWKNSGGHNAIMLDRGLVKGGCAINNGSARRVFKDR